MQVQNHRTESNRGNLNSILFPVCLFFLALKILPLGVSGQTQPVTPVVTPKPAVSPAQNSYGPGIKVKVIEESTGDPMPGVIIRVLGTYQGTITDMDGIAVLNLSEMVDSLSVSYLGYKTEYILHPRLNSEYVIKLKEVWDPGPDIIVRIYDNIPMSQGRRTVSRDLYKTNGGITPADALNMQPGVQMEERGAGGSRRLSIRGSLVRSPFGMRNVRTYWGNMPISSPDGTTPAEYLDTDVFPQMTIIKGPPGQCFGPSTAGMLKLDLTSFIDKPVTLNLGVTGNSAGNLIRFTAAQIASPGLLPQGKSAINFRYAGQFNQGYREHEKNQRNLFALEWSRHLRSDKHILRLKVLGFQGGWQLPGAINETELALSSTQALPYSVAMNASLKKSSARAGLEYQWTPNSSFIMHVLAYGEYGEKINPFGTSPFNQGYKDEKTPAAGTTFKVEKLYSLGRLRWLKLLAGTELQWEHNRYQENDNDSGQAGNLRWLMLQNSRQAFAWAEVDVYHASRWAMTAGISINTASFTIRDLNSPAATGSLSGRRGFGPQRQHSLAGSWYFSDSRIVGVSARWSRGFSTPTLWEIFLPDGKLLSSLKSETNDQVEASLFITNRNENLKLEITAYHGGLRNMILPYTDTTGVTLYNNAGQTRQQGIEACLNLKETFGHDGNYLSFWASAALQDYRFVSYIRAGTDLAGNYIPGIAPWTASINAVCSQRDGDWWMNASCRYQAGVPLNDENLDHTPDAILLSVSAGWRLPIANDMMMVRGGATNLLGQTTYSFLSLNAANGRFYNLAPGRSFWAGISFRI